MWKSGERPRIREFQAGGLAIEDDLIGEQNYHVGKTERPVSLGSSDRGPTEKIDKMKRHEQII